MKTKILSLFIPLIIITGWLFAGESDENEIRNLIISSAEQQRKTKQSDRDEYSNKGALEFWSSGGLIHEVGARGRPEKYDMINVFPKHINVISLIPGEAAVAMYYSEGALRPKGYAAVSHYMTRVTQVFVRENGCWKVRASHWSPIQGGSGTSQTAME